MPAVLWEDDRHFTVDGVPFTTVVDRRADREGFPIFKGRRHIERWLELLGQHRGETLVELGVAGGGSVALALLLLEPALVVAFDIEPIPRRLERFVNERGLADRVRLHGEVDQADGATLARLLDEDLGDAGIDVVIDDASHLLDPTRAAFDVLFPRLRPGGWYLVEDWDWQHQNAEGVRRAHGGARPDPAVGRRREVPGGGPLSELAVEALVAKACRSPWIGDLHASAWWFGVQRSPTGEGTAPFSLRGEAADHFGQLRS